jgi:hypothetical protein
MLKLMRSTAKEMSYEALITLKGRLEHKYAIQELNRENTSQSRHDLRVVNSELATREDQKTAFKRRVLRSQ